MKKYAELIKYAAFCMKQSKSIIISSGAGLSVDSGLSTYRGINVFLLKIMRKSALGKKLNFIKRQI